MKLTLALAAGLALTAGAAFAQRTDIVVGMHSGDAGYQRWADAEPDPEVLRLLRLNGREEAIHAERVRQALAILGVDA